MSIVMRQSPIIGVTPLWDAERKSIWMLPDYLDGIRAASGIPVVLPLEMGEADANRLWRLVTGFCLRAVRMSVLVQNATGWRRFCFRKPCKLTKPYSASAVVFSSSTCFWAVRFGRTFPHNILRRLSTDKASLTVLRRIKSC